MSFEPYSRAEISGRLSFKSRLWTLRLNLVAAIITAGILALSFQGVWNERQEAWNSAERASRNLLTTLTRDLGGDIASLDMSLKRVIQGIGYQNFGSLPPEVQHRMLFDQAISANLAQTVLLLGKTGDLIADGGSVLAPRDINFSDAEFFKIHKDQHFIGLYVSRPYESRIRPGILSIALSRRLARPDGEFNGVVVAEIALPDIYDLFQNLNIGRDGSITLLRNDGIILMRLPYDRKDIGRDLSDTSNFQRFRQEGSGSFEGIAAIDQIQRLYTFSRVDDLPLILTVSLSADEILAPWWRRALVLALITSVLCGAVIRLMFLFRRELGRRTRAEEELAQLARLDSLTGQLNRRSFDMLLDKEWRQATRLGSPLSLLFVDVDHFKSYNDQYGHARGDDALRAIAAAIANTVRQPRDFSARYGGEEFTVVLPETERADAQAVADAIRRAVAGLDIEHERSSLGVATVSIGVATAKRMQGSDASTLLKAADAALYEAKKAGRNCVRVADAELALS